MANLQISVEELRKYKIFVGTPMYGGNCTGSYTKSCTDLAMICAANGITIKFYYLFNESLIQRARNYVVDEFMRSDCTHLIFIDSDIAFDPRDVLGMLAIQVADPKKYNIVTGPYPKKTIAWEKVKAAADQGKADESPFELDQYTADYVFNPVKGTAQFSVTDPLKVMEIGTGFMLVKREVFAQMEKEYPMIKYKPDHVGQAHFDGSRYIHAYFDTVIDPVSERYLSEDYMFCQWWRNMGGSIWLCPWMRTQHIGTYHFQGDMPAVANYVGEM